MTYGAAKFHKKHTLRKVRGEP